MSTGPTESTAETETMSASGTEPNLDPASLSHSIPRFVSCMWRSCQVCFFEPLFLRRMPSLSTFSGSCVGGVRDQLIKTPEDNYQLESDHMLCYQHLLSKWRTMSSIAPISISASASIKASM
eukprot:SAG11_NODE_626_length_8100_cov_5.500875_6_plen_122_part_00